MPNQSTYKQSLNPKKGESLSKALERIRQEQRALKGYQNSTRWWHILATGTIGVGLLGIIA